MFSFCAVGQTEVNIKGKVMDLQHRPIPGVIVNNGINFYDYRSKRGISFAYRYC